MKFIECKKYNDGTRKIFFCGIRIFKYKKKVSDYLKTARSFGVKLGNNVRLINAPHWGSEPYFIEIDDNTVISFDVVFLTHDGCVYTCRQYCDSDINKFGKIKIGKNCFIGCRSTILPNVTIGDNCIVGACSVVTKNIPSGEVWAGNPAKFICRTEALAKKLYEKSKTPEQIELCEYVKKVRNIKK